MLYQFDQELPTLEPAQHKATKASKKAHQNKTTELPAPRVDQAILDAHSDAPDHAEHNFNVDAHTAATTLQESHAANAQTADGTEPTDEQLMDRIAMKEDAALVALYRRHMPLLRTIVARVINNDADVDDLIQQIFLEVWYQADRYDVAKGKALGWIVTLARRRAIDKLRKRQAYSRVEERLRVEVEHEAEQTPCGQGADSDAIDSDRSEILQRILSALPEPQQEALQLAFYRGMSQREIAAYTGIPLGTIKTRIELAVRKVRSALLAMGGASEWELCHH